MGATRQYAGRCTAVARYELGAEGPHALVVRQLYGDYDAVSEYWDRRRPKWHARPEARQLQRRYGGGTGA